MTWADEINTVIRMTANTLGVPLSELIGVEDIRVQAAELRGVARTEYRAIGECPEALRLASNALAQRLRQYRPRARKFARCVQHLHLVQ
jgi:hypothetical protein